MKKIITIIFLSVFFLSSCSNKESKATAPWGETMNDTVSKSKNFTMSDIVNNGELIMLTMNGPDNYYEYHGAGFGTQYLLCEKFAQKLGVSLRVEVCRDTAELVRRLNNGDGDIIAFQLPKNIKGRGSLVYCGARIDSLHTQWAVKKGNMELADTLNKWFRPEMVAQINKEETYLLSSGSVRRHVYSPMLSSKGGIISKYDNLFMSYGSAIRWDWRLLAAQCYQESCFDPKATSWAGACGLMQIMPSTAAHLGLPTGDLYDPEANISAASRYLIELSNKLRDVRDPMERTYFVLACYNGGYNHVRDAMALTNKNGRDQYRWADVSYYILQLCNARYYNDPIVKHGYMRGTETVDYVDRIRQRWAQYRGVAHPGSFRGGSHHIPSFNSDYMTPHRAKKHYRFHI